MHINGRVQRRFIYQTRCLVKNGLNKARPWPNSFLPLIFTFLVRVHIFSSVQVAHIKYQIIEEDMSFSCQGDNEPESLCNGMRDIW